MSGINKESIMSKINEYVKKLSGNVSLNTLFPPEFIQKHSDFSSIKELLLSVGVKTQEMFDEWTENADNFIADKTDFVSWQQMLDTAAKQYAKYKQETLRDGSFKEETFENDDIFSNIHIFLNFSAQ